MTDILSPDERSTLMAKVRSTGNRSTEGRVEAALVETRIEGWEKHPKSILGKPDFYFPMHRLALFVDGCYWHACPICKPRLPSTRAEFWRTKIDENRRRDNRVHRKLRQRDYHVLRVWEHDLRSDAWLKRLRTMLRRIEEATRERPE
jgi:DNA mismatch endonuclease (patch repair protein)